MPTFDLPNAKGPQFFIKINQALKGLNNGKVIIPCYMLEDGFGATVKSTYSAPFEDMTTSVEKMIADIRGAATFDTGRMLGVENINITGQIKNSTFKIWKGGDHIGLTFKLIFVADSDPENEVYNKGKILMMLCAPVTNTSGFIQTPFTGQDETQKKNVVSIYIKDPSSSDILFKMDDVLPESAQVTYSTVMVKDDSGKVWPMYGQCDFAVTTRKIVTRFDIDSMFSKTSIP